MLGCNDKYKWIELERKKILAQQLSDSAANYQRAIEDSLSKISRNPERYIWSLKKHKEICIFSYFGGGTGVFTSGFVWCVAGFNALFYSNQSSMLTLFFWWYVYSSIRNVVIKNTKAPPESQPWKPLGKLALESTIIIFVGLFLAFYVAQL